VYTTAILLFLLSCWLTLHAVQRRSLARAALASAALGLTLAGHLTFIPPVIVLGAVLVLRRPPGGVSRIGYTAILLLAFIVGLTPYLYLVYADSADYPVNYLDYTIELGSGQYGLTPRTFDDFWERIPWLVFGQESKPKLHVFYPLGLYYALLQVAVTLFVYQFGPLGLLLCVPGVHRIASRSRARLFALSCITAFSVLLGLAFGLRRMMPIFILPATITVAAVIAHGFWALQERPAGRAGRVRSVRAVLVPLIVAVAICTPHVIRVLWNGSDGIAPALKIPVESGPEIDTFIPHLRGHTAPREYGERVLSLAPENSFVVGKWKRIMVLYYFLYAEGRRRDITLEPYYSQHRLRLENWERTHDPGSHPFVFLNDIPGLTDRLSGLDSLTVDGNERIYVTRKALVWK
jgi:hypothetical protein